MNIVLSFSAPMILGNTEPLLILDRKKKKKRKEKKNTVIDYIFFSSPGINQC